METPIADIWSLPNAREALTIFAMFCATYSTRLIGCFETEQFHRRFAVLWKLLRVA